MRTNSLHQLRMLTRKDEILCMVRFWILDIVYALYATVKEKATMYWHGSYT